MVLFPMRRIFAKVGRQVPGLRRVEFHGRGESKGRPEPDTVACKPGKKQTCCNFRY